MKAAVIARFGDVPRYADFPEPVAAPGDARLTVTAAALENFDKLVAAGQHYSSAGQVPEFPAIAGHSGVGTRADGTLVAFGGVRPPYGTMAERAVVPAALAGRLMPVPAGVDPLLAAALPAAALTSLLPLKYGVGLASGQSVLVNGGTGVAGKLAIQVARHLGAGRIVASGRNEAGLAQASALGADVLIDTRGTDAAVTAAFRAAAGAGYDVILDFLWGRPTELLLAALVPDQVGFATHRTALVQIGQAAGAALTLRAESLRTSGLRLSGAGDVPAAAVPEAVQLVWTWLARHEIAMEVEAVPLREVAAAWTRPSAGKRLVLVP